MDGIYGRGVALTPTDTLPTPYTTYSGLYVGGAGAVVLELITGETVTFAGVPAGTYSAFHELVSKDGKPAS